MKYARTAATDLGHYKARCTVLTREVEAIRKSADSLRAKVERRDAKLKACRALRRKDADTIELAMTTIERLQAENNTRTRQARALRNACKRLASRTPSLPSAPPAPAPVDESEAAATIAKLMRENEELRAKLSCCGVEV